MKKLTFLTGAGISAESGIKTFRDSDGLWENHNVMDVASISGWGRNKQLVLDFYNQRRQQLNEVEPNDAHKIITELQEYFDVNVITQNVDDLHERAGNKNVLHLHGELRKMCSSYNKEIDILEYEQDIKLGDTHPDGSQLRPYIVWFGEDVPKMYDAVQIVQNTDIFVVIGTSLEVYPAASLTTYVKPECVIYNIDPKPTVIPNINLKIITDIATNGMRKLKEELLQDI